MLHAHCQPVADNQINERLKNLVTKRVVHVSLLCSRDHRRLADRDNTSNQVHLYDKQLFYKPDIMKFYTFKV